MGNPEHLVINEDYRYLLQFLPEGWQQQAKHLGALRRCRGIPDAETLLQVLLVHLAEGISLRETATRFKTAQLVELSDVAIMERLKGAGEWFRWMNTELMNQWVSKTPPQVFGTQREIVLVDGTRIKEPGPTGSSWCLHYGLTLPQLCCVQMQVLDHHGAHESFARFQVRPGALYVGDRAYAPFRSIGHVLHQGGEVLVRFPLKHLPLWSEDGHRFDVLAHARTLSTGECGDWQVSLQDHHPGRVCIIKKSRQATQQALRAVRRAAQKHGNKTHPETLEAAGYVLVFTSLPRTELPAAQALELYRGRWQIELVFKRLKSILGLGHLRKHDEVAARSWLYGKLFVALLIEALLRAGESFFPWGYPLKKNQG